MNFVQQVNIIKFTACLVIETSIADEIFVFATFRSFIFRVRILHFKFTACLVIETPIADEIFVFATFRSFLFIVCILQ